MKLDIRYANHPDDMKRYGTDELRRHFHADALFQPGQISLTYSHVDRVVFGGAFPKGKTLTLAGGKDFGTEVFLERRELGVICIAGKGTVKAGDQTYNLEKAEGLYVGMGTPNIEFSGDSEAKFYLMSSPAHRNYPTVKITKEMASPQKLGSPETLNVRTIFKYVHPAVCESCQLSMGMTILEPGSVWNTMPCHTHDRRMEVYFYFDMAESTRVFHFHGQPQETRHIVMANEEAVISPSWSIHTGVGTGDYTFIWGMAGENQTFDDMDQVRTQDLR